MTHSPDTTATRNGRVGTYALMAIVVVTLGSNWPIQTTGLRYLSPLWMASIRLLIALVATTVIASLTSNLHLPRRRDLPVVWTVGFFRLPIVFMLVFTGLEIVPPGRSAVLVWTASLWTVPLAAMFLGERMTRQRWLGLTIGISGIVLLFEPWRLSSMSGRTVTGHVLLLLAAVVNAASAVHIRRHGWTSTTLELMPWQLLVASIPITILALMLEGSPGVTWTPSLTAIMGYQGLLATSLAVWAQQTVLQRMPAVSTNLTLMAVPVVGLFTSAIFVNEVLTVATLAGLILVLGGVGANVRADAALTP